MTYSLLRGFQLHIFKCEHIAWSNGSSQEAKWDHSKDESRGAPTGHYQDTTDITGEMGKRDSLGKERELNTKEDGKREDA